MITILKGERNKFEKVNELGSDIWINLVRPTTTDVLRIQEGLGIPQDFLTAALDINEKSRTDRDGDVKLILLRIPHPQDKKADFPFTTLPLGIILTNDLIITICLEETEILQDFFGGQTVGWSTKKRYRLLLQVMLKIASKYLHYLRLIDKETDMLEDQLQRSMRNQELLELLRYQKSLVYFTTALKSNELMMERLQKSGGFSSYPDDQELLEDVLTENQQAIEMVGISSNILSQMMDAFASIISNNLNVVMKFLASATIVLSLPTLVASFYGMNVTLPLQDSPYAFLLTLFFSLVLSFVVIVIFLKRNWF